ncbi:MAG: hypothetical protein EOO41_01475, partial [Methanobacteriota archaeon]
MVDPRHSRDEYAGLHMSVDELPGAPHSSSALLPFFQSSSSAREIGFGSVHDTDVLAINQPADTAPLAEDMRPADCSLAAAAVASTAGGGALGGQSVGIKPSGAQYTALDEYMASANVELAMLSDAASPQRMSSPARVRHRSRHAARSSALPIGTASIPSMFTDVALSPVRPGYPWLPAIATSTIRSAPPTAAGVG